MINPTDPRSLSQTRREPITQIRAITTLLRLAQEDAPSAKWTVGDDRTLGYTFDGAHALEGHLMDGTDDELRRGLSAWQRVLGAGPVDVRRYGDTLHLSIAGSYEGLAVGMVTVVDAEGAPEAVAA